MTEPALTEIVLLAKVTAVLAVALIAVGLLRRTRASVRALVLACAFTVVIVLPIVPALVPARTIAIPAAYVDAVPFVLEAPEADAAVPVVTAIDAPTRATRQMPSVLAIARSVWALVTLAILTRLILALGRLRTLRRTGRSWRDRAPHGVEVFLHDHLTAPMTFGLRRPAIGLPLDAASWDEAHLRDALTHELEHVRRGDWAVSLLARIGCAVYWFHPLAWMAARQLCLEAERACDDAVLARSERTAYAEQLVTLARRLPRRGPAAVLSMAARSDLSARVRAILDPQQARGPAGLCWTFGVVAVALATAATISPLQAVAGHLAPQAASPAPAGRGQPPAGLPQGLAAMVDSPTSGPDAPRFDATSIKRSTARDNLGGSLIGAGGQFRATSATLVRLIRVGYGLRMTDIIVGGPDWAKTEGYDVDARPASGVSVAEARLMIRTLLADRFGLVVRKDVREGPVYALTVARTDRRLGPQIARPSGECTNPMLAIAQNANATPAGTARTPPAQVPIGQPGRLCGMFTTGDAGNVNAGSTAMSGLIQLLTPAVDRPIVDRTGLTGVFDFDLRYAGGGATFGAAAFGRGRGALTSPDTAPDPANEAPTIFTALQEQLGLKLEPDRGSVPVLVIDRAERPAANDSPELFAPAQATTAPVFDVVSVRQNVSGSGAPSTRIDATVLNEDAVHGGRFVATNVPLQQLIADAYRLPITGGPEWIRSARGPRRPGDIRFDVVATIPAGTRASQIPAMLQTMLAQRFNLAVRRETREQPAYLLVHAREDKRLGPQLTPSSQQCQTQIEGGPLRAPVGRVAEDGKPVCSIMTGPARIRGGGLTLRFLANALGGFAGRPVVDRTGLQGPFDFDLQYTPAGRGAPSDDNRPSIFTAVQEQLGLELRPAMEPIEVLVIDRVSMPSEN